MKTKVKPTYLKPIVNPTCVKSTKWPDFIASIDELMKLKELWKIYLLLTIQAPLKINNRIDDFIMDKTFLLSLSSSDGGNFISLATTILSQTH